ncbi:trafficking PGA2 domain-containing protein [Trichoderma ceciliae]
MDSQSHQQYQQDDAGQASLNSLGSIVAQLSQYGQNASNNLQKGFSDMSTKGWLRLIMVVCTYLLIRPYVIKYSTKYAVNKLEEQDVKDKKQAKEAVAKMSPNDLRGLNSAAEADVDVDEGADGSSADWGSKARVRQRKMLRKMLEVEEQRRWEDEDDEDIRDLLE